MLRSMIGLENYTIRAIDGRIGRVTDCFFDDDAWAIRYFVVVTGSWLSSREVLISAISAHHPDWREQALPVSITKEQVRNSADLDTHKPVSRQQEEELLSHYGYRNYWSRDGGWGEDRYPPAMVPGHAVHGADPAERERNLEAILPVQPVRPRNGNPQLRSCNAVVGYHIHATDGDVGHVADFLVDDETWSLRCFVIDTSKWWPGHKVLIAPVWVDDVIWSEKAVSVALSRGSIEGAPPYDSTLEWSRDQDLSLHRHYGRSRCAAHGVSPETDV